MGAECGKDQYEAAHKQRADDQTQLAGDARHALLGDDGRESCEEHRHEGIEHLLFHDDPYSNKRRGTHHR